MALQIPKLLLFEGDNLITLKMTVFADRNGVDFVELLGYVWTNLNEASVYEVVVKLRFSFDIIDLLIK